MDRHSTRRNIPVLIAMVLGLVLASGLGAQHASAAAATSIGNIVPMPASVTSTGGSFILSGTAKIYVTPDSSDVHAVGEYLAAKLRPATGYSLAVLGTSSTPARGNLYLMLGGEAALGAEGYLLTVTADMVTLRAYRAAGLFRGIQTIRQMLPPGIDSATVRHDVWSLATGSVRDLPRFAYRGAMLDVARHFQGIANVERLIDEMAYYKLNYLHLHLSDDQGWRIVIDGWPNLTAYGSGTQVGGACNGCYYTQAQYTGIVDYAAARYITVVPEIDMPGHTNAALASYAALNCNGVAPARRTDTLVGYSSLCTAQPLSAAVSNFVNAVVDQLAALTPGPYLHLGGDEAHSTDLAEYKSFVSQVQARVMADGKSMLGWEQIAQINDLSSASVAQMYSEPAYAKTAASKGARVLMSPCEHAYLDIQYDSTTPLGLHWCGYDSVQNSYSWDPATYVSGVPESSVLGIEGPLWSETIVKMADIEYMVWPRLAGLAELGWSPAAAANWTAYKVRLGSQGPRWELMGIDFYRSPEVPWQTPSVPIQVYLPLAER